VGHSRWLRLGVLAAALAAATHLVLAQPPGGGPGGGRGRGGRPFEVGKVQTVSEDGKTITLTSEVNADAVVTVTADDQTLYYAVWDVELADVAVGDVLVLRGTPVKIQVDQVQVGGDLRELLGFGGPGPNPPAGDAAGAAPPPPQPMAFGMVNGTVVQTNPLTVDVNGLQVEVQLAEGATLTAIARMEEPDIAAGDRVFVGGSRPEGADATTPLQARVIVADSTANGVQLMRGRGGPGGPGAPGGGRGN